MLDWRSLTSSFLAALRRELLPLVVLTAGGAVVLWLITAPDPYAEHGWSHLARVGVLVVVYGLGLLIPYLLFRMWRASARVGHRRSIFIAHLRSAVRMGQPLSEACEQVAGLPHDIAVMLQSCGRALAEGRSLSQALDGTWACMPPWYARFLAVGEAHGRLASALDAVIAADTDEELLRTRSCAAVAYPLAVAAMLFFSILWILHMIVPRLDRIWQELGAWQDQTAPGVIRLSRALDGLLPLWPYLLVFALVALTLPLPATAQWRRWRTPATVATALVLSPLLLPLALIGLLPWPWGRHPQRWWLCRRLPAWLTWASYYLPGLRRRTRSAALVRWSRMVGLLLETGCDLPEALATAEGVGAATPFAIRARRWRTAVTNGRDLSVVLSEDPWVPAWFAWQVRSRGLGSDLATILQEASRCLRDQLQRQRVLWVQLLAPLLILCMGWIVAQFLFAIFGFLTESLRLLLEDGAL